MSHHSDQLRLVENRLKNSFDQQLKNKDCAIKALQHEKEEYRRRASDDAKIAVQQEVDKLQNEILQRYTTLKIQK